MMSRRPEVRARDEHSVESRIHDSPRHCRWGYWLFDDDADESQLLQQCCDWGRNIFVEFGAVDRADVHRILSWVRDYTRFHFHRVL